jgi:hypothetical protein
MEVGAAGCRDQIDYAVYCTQTLQDLVKNRTDSMGGLGMGFFETVTFFICNHVKRGMI